MTEGMWLNSGGPSSRTRAEAIRTSILGGGSRKVRCPRRRVVGIRFPKEVDPVMAVRALCQQLGFSSAETARAAFADCMPDHPMVAMPRRGRPRVPFEGQSPEELHATLVEALILGLCTVQHYDPQRPVVWTKASLTRHLDLFSTEGFYAA